MLKDQMEKAGITQVSLAAHCGVSQPTVSNWLKHGVSLDHIEKVSKFTGLSPKELRPDTAKLFQ